MKGIDTNVLIRYLVADEANQTSKAKSYIESNIIYVNSVMLIETVWVLESAYGQDKKAIIAVLERLLSTHEIEIENAEVALAALQNYRESTAGFTDCFIGCRNAVRGCDETGSFDKRAKNVIGFRLL